MGEFPIAAGQYFEAMRVINEARQERKALQLEKMLDDALLDAYEQHERTAAHTDLNRL